MDSNVFLKFSPFKDIEYIILFHINIIFFDADVLVPGWPSLKVGISRYHYFSFTDKVRVETLWMRSTVQNSTTTTYNGRLAVHHPSILCYKRSWANQSFRLYQMRRKVDCHKSSLR